MSATPEPRVPVGALREAVRRAVEATSGHQVAAALGISQGGVRKFLKGSEPHPATLRKLAAWYVRHAAGSQSLDADTAAAALSLLVDDYPEVERELVRASLKEVLREAHRRAGTKPPPWLAES